MKTLFVVFVTLWSFFGQTDCSNILAITTVASPSHHIWSRTLLFGLLERGHKVTLLTHENEEQMHQNLTVYRMEGVYEKLAENFNYTDFAAMGPLESMKIIYEWIHFLTLADIETDGLKKFLKDVDNQKFDVILWDIISGTFLLPLVQKLGSPPIVALSPFGIVPDFAAYMGIDLDSSTVPFYGLPYASSMSLKERSINLFVNLFSLYFVRTVHWPRELAAAKRLFGPDVQDLETTFRNISLMLASIDPVLDYPRALPPQVISVGGIHAKPAKKLPKDLQKFMDEAENGVIVFSLGSNLRSDQIGDVQRTALLTAFGRLKQRIVWKFETENFPNLPKNVLVKKWLPQNDLLAHFNVRLFIGHGGSLSTQEAMYHGVPMVAIPFGADQHVIAKKLSVRKLGESLDYGTMTSDQIYYTITKVMSDPDYKNNMGDLSKRFRDQPQTPLERAIYWTEYVIRQQGAQFLSVESKNMPFYKMYFLDIIALIDIVMFLEIYILYRALRWCCASQSSKQKTA